MRYKVYEILDYWTKRYNLITETNDLQTAIKIKKREMLFTNKDIKIIDTTTNKEVKTTTCLHQTTVLRNNYIKMY